LILCDKLFRFRPLGPYFIARYLVYLLRAKPTRIQIESSTNGASSSMQNIGQGVLRNLLVAMPPLDEQQRICNKIAEETQGLVAAVEGADREIALIREYRTRLVADVVTGQLDVRAVAAGLPDEETDEAELSDLQDEADLLELSDDSKSLQGDD
jgi:type I restriction enzyme S subunit